LVKTQPILTTNCSDPIPDLPVPVGSCLVWEFINRLDPNETVTFIYTDCDRFNWVITVDNQFNSNFTFCGFYPPIFISGSPTNNVFQRLWVYQTQISQCGCYYGCSSGYECIPLVRYGNEMTYQESWTIPYCGGLNIPSVITNVIGSPIPYNYANIGYSACTVNPFQWWFAYNNRTNDPCVNYTRYYPTIVPNLQNPSNVLGGWKGMLQSNTFGETIFDLTLLGNNIPRLIAKSCGCNDIGFVEEVCVSIRDCCTDNIIYTGTILTSNYNWVTLNYTVDNLGITNCCLYLSDFVQPIVSPSEYGLYNHNYTYPNGDGYIRSYQYTSCSVCNPPPVSITPTTTITPTPTPFPIYRWQWISSNTPSMGANFNCNQNSCFINNILLNRYTLNPYGVSIDLSNYLNNFINNIITIENTQSGGGRFRSFNVTNVQQNSNDIYNLTVVPTSSCNPINNFNFVQYTFYNIKFLKR